jgi:hypothetical protein
MIIRVAERGHIRRPPDPPPGPAIGTARRDSPGATPGATLGANPATAQLPFLLTNFSAIETGSPSSGTSAHAST